MELVASLPPDLAALADPTARAAAPPLRPTDRDDAAAAAAAPFDLLLALLITPHLPGESLPPAGNALPTAAVDAAADSTSTSVAFAKPVTPSTLSSASGADLLAQLKLVAASAADDQNSALPARAADASLPFSDLEVPATPEVAKPVVPAAAAPAVTSETVAAPDPDVASLLHGMLKDAPPRSSRPSPARGPEPAIARLPAGAVVTDPHAEQTAATAPAPVAQIADAAPRPARREAAFEAFALPIAPTASDAAAPPSNAAPALAPPQPHAATTAAPAPTVDASALGGHGAAIDTRADNWHEALASRVQVLVDQHVGEAHIKLNPPELGSVDIKISLVDDKTFVQLTAGTSAARDELTQSLPKLRELLSASGLSFGGASVHGGSAGQGGHETAPRFSAPAYAPIEFPSDVELEPVRGPARRAGRIDLFA